jgi:hypothetical protein
MDLKNKIKKTTSSVSIPQVVSELLQSAVNIHIMHLRTKSYAEHKALNEYYDAIPGHADDIAEQYQGQYGIQSYPAAKITMGTDCCQYLENLVDLVNKAHNESPDSHIQNQLDEVKSLIYSTLYKLENLS